MAEQRSRSSTPSSALGLTDHGYNTRRAARQAQMPQQLQILSVTRPLALGEYLAACSLDAQQTFLEGVGMVTTQVEPLEEVLDSEVAEMLSCALRHKRIDNPNLTDPYFTEEQWHNVQSKAHTLLDDAEELVEELLVRSAEQETGTQQKGERMVSKKKRTTPVCMQGPHM